MAENLRIKMDIKINESNKITNRINPYILTPKLIIIKPSKVKDKENFESNKRKAIQYKGKCHQALDFSVKCSQIKKKWDNIFNILKVKN